jgi:hypothetical protein
MPSLKHITTSRAGAALLVAVAAAVAGSAPITGQSRHWPQWRGPDMSGVVADHPGLPERWSASENVAWKVRVPGLGWSSPIVWGNDVFVTSVVASQAGEAPKKGLYLPPTGTERPPDPPAGTHEWKVYCFDLQTGKMKWERTAHQGAVSTPRHPKNSYASETPVTDGERLYVVFGNVGIFTSRSSTTTRDRRSRRSTSAPAVRTGEPIATRATTGRRRSSGGTASEPRSSPPVRNGCGPTIRLAGCCGSSPGR